MNARKSIAESKFPGFEIPKQNFSKLPHSLVDRLSMIDSLAELKVVLYLLRHTWGFSEFGEPKKITTDEFMNGRKRKDGTRMDHGTGLSNNSVITGLAKAVEHGFIVIDVNDSDKGRVKKYYRLNMAELPDEEPDEEPDVQILEPDVQNLHIDYAKSARRTEKETIERNPPKESAGGGFKIPKNLQPYFEVCTGQLIALPRPVTQKELNTWLETFEEWHLKGYTPSQVEAAGQKARDEGKIVARPKSLTWRLNDGYSRAHRRKPPLPEGGGEPTMLERLAARSV